MAGNSGFLSSASQLVSRSGRQSVVSLRDKGGQVFNARAYGCQGDGSSDDTAAIRELLKKVAAVGGVAFFPAGTYLVSQFIRLDGNAKPFVMAGAGIGLTTFKRTAGPQPFDFWNLTRAELRDFTIDGNFAAVATGASHGLALYQCSDTFVRRVEVRDFKNTGILTYTGVANTWYNVVYEDCVIDGLGVANNGLSIVDMNFSGMRGCMVKGCPGAPGIALQLKNDCRYCFIEDCQAETSTNGVAFGQDGSNGVNYSRVAGVNIRACTAGLVTGYASQNVISGITIDHNGGTTNHAIRLQNSVGNALTGIVVYNVGATRLAIFVDTGSNDNYAHLDMVHLINGGLVVGYASGVLRNFTRVCRVSDPTSYATIVSILDDVSTNTTNLVEFNGQFSQAVQVNNKFRVETGTVTADSPNLYGSSTWNNAAVAFEGIRLQITDTASLASSALLHLRVNSFSRFRVDKKGNVIANAFVGSTWRTWMVQQNSGLTSINNAGFTTVPTANGTAAVNNTSSGQFIQYTSGTTSNSEAGWEWAAYSHTQLQFNSIGNLVIMTGSDITAQRIWCGLFSADPMAADTNNAIHSMAFRYSTSASDTTWKVVHCNGTTQTVVDSGVTVAATTRYVLRVDASDTASVVFYINAVAVATVTTTLPGSSTGLAFAANLRITGSGAGSARVLNVSQVRLDQE